VNPRAQAGAVLEYLPDPVLPFRGSRLFQRISPTADRESTVILGETLLPGHVAHGEAHVYDLYRSETEVCRSDGGLLFSDVLRLGPADDRHPTSIGLLGEYDVVATLYVISGRTDPIAMVAGLRAALESCPRFAGRRQRIAQRLRCRHQTAWLHLEGSADGAGHGVERGTPGAARDSGAHPAQGIARSAVRTPPPPPVRSHLADVGRDQARLSWRSWKARRDNGPHNAPVIKRSSSTTPSTMAK
jgi:UreD urease accessory protein